MSEPHYVTYDATEEDLTFTCTGDETAGCHNYPDCECETWGPDHEHPFTPHATCWMAHWFNEGNVHYFGDNEDGNGSPTISFSGRIETEFDRDCILWSWVGVDVEAGA